MDFELLCKGCFSEKGNQEECPYCHFKEEATQDVQEASLFLVPGTILLDKYVIGNVLGQGGFGITYIGWDINLNIKLAIKEFFPQGMVSRIPGHSQVVSYKGTEKEQYEFGLDRFLKEARTLAQFENHPNIVSVRDFFKANGTAYMIMSYVEGMTFEKYLKEQGGKIDFSKALDVMMPVMDALKEVHKKGLIHRDISPDNILIDNEGRVILIDFGAARQALRDKSKSLSVILKAGYAPEEQYRSKGEQGEWTDIYAVGATIYRAITGEVPPESIERLNEDTLVVPSDRGVEINKNQQTALIKALAVKPSKRYDKVEKFQEALDVAKQNKAVQDLKKMPRKKYYVDDVKIKLKTPSLLVAGFFIFLLIAYGGVSLYGALIINKNEAEVIADKILDTNDDEDILVDNGSYEDQPGLIIPNGLPGLPDDDASEPGDRPSIVPRWDEDQPGLITPNSHDPGASSANSITNITFNPPGGTYEANTYIDFTFNYKTRERDGVRIIGRPLYNGVNLPSISVNLTPNEYMDREGSGSGSFRSYIAQPVNQFRFRMFKISTNEMILEKIVNVNYSFE